MPKLLVKSIFLDLREIDIAEQILSLGRYWVLQNPKLPNVKQMQAMQYTLDHECEAREIFSVVLLEEDILLSREIRNELTMKYDNCWSFLDFWMMLPSLLRKKRALGFENLFFFKQGHIKVSFAPEWETKIINNFNPEKDLILRKGLARIFLPKRPNMTASA